MTALDILMIAYSIAVALILGATVYSHFKKAARKERIKIMRRVLRHEHERRASGRLLCAEDWTEIELSIPNAIPRESSQPNATA